MEEKKSLQPHPLTLQNRHFTLVITGLHSEKVLLFLLHQISCFAHTGVIAMLAVSDQVIYHFFDIINITIKL